MTGVGAAVEARLILTDSSPSLISISATSEVSMSSMSFLTFRISMVDSQQDVAIELIGDGQLAERSFQGQFVAMGTQSDYGTDSSTGQEGFLAEVFSFVHIGQVHFDKRDLGCQKRVQQGDAGVGEGSRIDQNEGRAILAGCMESIYEHVLGIGLQAIKFVTLGLAHLRESSVDIFKGVITVNVRFAITQQIEVWSVHYQDACHGDTCLLLVVPVLQVAAWPEKKNLNFKSIGRIY